MGRSGIESATNNRKFDDLPLHEHYTHLARADIEYRKNKTSVPVYMCSYTERQCRIKVGAIDAAAAALGSFKK